MWFTSKPWQNVLSAVSLQWWLLTWALLSGCSTGKSPWAGGSAPWSSGSCWGCTGSRGCRSTSARWPGIACLGTLWRDGKGKWAGHLSTFHDFCTHQQAQEIVSGSTVQQGCCSFAPCKVTISYHGRLKGAIHFVLIFRKEKSRNLEFLQYGTKAPSQIKPEHIHGFVVETHGYSLLLYFIDVRALIACLDYD